MRSSQTNRQWSAPEETYRDLGLFWVSYRRGAEESQAITALKAWAVMSGLGTALMALALAVVR